MKKRKLLILVITLVLCCIGLFGCTSSKNEIVKGNEGGSEAINFKMLSNQGFNSGVGTKDGYYTLWLNDEGGKNIMYVDYNTKQQIYLCDKSSCKHNNDKCTSYIDTKLIARENSLLCDGKYLYLISSEYNQAGSIGSSYTNPEFDGLQREDEPTTIYRMNLDGSDKKLLCTFQSGELFGREFFTDGKNIYAIVMTNESVKIDDNSSYTKGDNYKLVAIAIENGERKNYDGWSSEWEILGCYDDRILIKELKFDHELSDKERMDEGKYMQAYQKAVEVIGTFDLESKKFEKLFSNKAKMDYRYEVFENNIFYYRMYGDEIKNFNLESKKPSTFWKTKYSNIQQIYDGYIITSDWKETNRQFYRIRIKDKDIKKVVLLKDNNLPVNIIAESNDFFFVESNCKVEEEYVEWAGVTQTVEKDREYAIINKDDYFKDKKKFQKVRLIMTELN